MLKRRLHRLVRVYTGQNTTLFEITCQGSNVFDNFGILIFDVSFITDLTINQEGKICLYSVNDIYLKNISQ